jgi:hypothetical protein
MSLAPDPARSSTQAPGALRAPSTPRFDWEGCTLDDIEAMGLCPIPFFAFTGRMNNEPYYNVFSEVLRNPLSPIWGSTRYFVVGGFGYPDDPWQDPILVAGWVDVTNAECLLMLTTGSSNLTTWNIWKVF